MVDQNNGIRASKAKSGPFSKYLSAPGVCRISQIEKVGFQVDDKKLRNALFHITQS